MNALLNVNWFDVGLVLMILLGFNFGRRRGMSRESVDLLQWIVILGLCTLGYQPLGRLLGDFSGFKPWANYTIAYLILAMVVMLVFNAIRRRYAEKLGSSHVFGKGEFYLGMAGGTLRFLLITLVGLALIHPFAPARGGASSGARFQQEELGSVFFPTLGTVQQDIFQGSVSGKWIGENLTFLLIEKPTAPKAQAKR
jgi:uncharacterized membrane protein required for colicin V production